MNMRDDRAAAAALRRAQDAREATRKSAERSAAAARQAAMDIGAARQLATEVAGTEARLAITLREMASRAAQQGRPADAARLAGEAEAAEHYAGVERQRARG